MPDALTPTRLRELIAAATPGPWIRHGSHFYAESDKRLLGTIAGPVLVENADLLLGLVNNSSALAEALEAKELLEWLVFSDVSILRDGDKIAIVTDGSDPIVYLPWMEALRAARKEDQ